jgi:ribonuclease P protein component
VLRNSGGTDEGDAVQLSTKAGERWEIKRFCLSAMLPKSHRLRNRRDFQRVYQHGRQFRSPLIALYAMPRPAPRSTRDTAAEVALGPRVGISVSKKVGGAVQRNRVKRRLREACRRVIPDLAGSIDFVLVAAPAGLAADWNGLVGVVEELMLRADRDHSRGELVRPRRPAGGHRRRS